MKYEYCLNVSWVFLGVYFIIYMKSGDGHTYRLLIFVFKAAGAVMAANKIINEF